MTTKVIVTGFLAIPGMTQYKHNVMMQWALEDVGRFWHDTIRAKHFTKAGAREYEYQPRSGEPGKVPRKGYWSSYTARKQRLLGHTQPLMWSGETERATRKRDIRATSKSVTIKFHAPPYFNYRPENWRELTEVSRRDEEAMTDRLTGRIMTAYETCPDVEVTVYTE